MKKSIYLIPMLFFFCFCQLSAAEEEHKISQTEMAGDYKVTLKVLPPEAFEGPKAEMVWDGGAQPNYLNSKPSPNHHLVTFIVKGMKNVEQANVTIRYRIVGHKQWKMLPVARMHVAGKGLETTHFGNNVFLEPGNYEVQVRVDESAPAVFHVQIS